MVNRALSRGFSVALDKAALVGAGSTANEPLGLFGSTNVPSVSLGATGAAITGYSPFLNALQTLQNNNVDVPISQLRAVMAPRSFRQIIGLSSTNDGQPLQPPPAIRPLIENGFEVTSSVPINQKAGSSTELDASSIFVGSYRDMMVGIRSDLRVEILRERYAENLQYGIVAYARYDVQHEHPESFVKIIKRDDRLGK
jgi:HK97 family phage major capsid protein